tara:strand:+ start:566 stop:955 length:390 start_codon:yes stop_codon:yes gene_type:complete
MANPILTGFNNQFGEFIEDILRIFPNDKDLITSKNLINLVKKGNPKLLIKIWKENIYDVYSQQIEQGDIGFFIEKDYKKDVKQLGESDKVIQTIERLRDPIRNMDETNQQACMKYIQNLSKLSHMYFSN